MSEAQREAGGAPVAHPYRHSIAGALGASLVAGLAAGLIDIVVTLGRSDGGGSLALITLALYAVPCVMFGAAAGIVAGAWRATFGDGAVRRAIRRMRDEPELDARVSGGLLAFGVVAVAFALFAAMAAGTLVAGVQRKGVGALLLGGVLAASLPLFALASLPIYRVTRRVGRLAPRVGPVPGAMVLCAAIAGLGGLGVAFILLTRLDTRALDLGIFYMAGAFAAAFVTWLVVSRGPLDGVRRRVPGGPVVIIGTVIAVALPFVCLRGAPATNTAVALSEHSVGARFFVGVGRKLIDRDGDGHSPFLGGPDCDDTRASVNPDAPEVPGNGIDDNCIGGDRPKTASNPTPPAPVPAKPAADNYKFDGNLLFIAIDTVRGDALGITGYKRDGESITPNIDALAKRSSYFTNAFSQAPNTPRSLPSTFCSRYPSQVAVDRHFKNFSDVAPAAVSMWEVLQDAGMLTTGISSHFYFVRAPGATQGFTRYDNEGAKSIRGSNADVASPRLVPKAIAQLEEFAKSGKRFGMFLHLFEPHSSYVKHPEYPIKSKGIQSLSEKYDFEIKYTDVWIGKLLAALDKTGLAKNTMVVVMSDHGEAFGVHRVAGKRMFFHGQTLYDELLRVPLIVHIPGLEPRKIESTVMLTDLAPTLVQALGAPRPKEFVGRSLLPALRGKDLPPRPAYAELLPAPSWRHAWKAMVTADGTHKLIYRMSEKRFELYNLKKDREERRDLVHKNKALAKKLKAQLIQWMEVDLPAGKP